MARRSRLGQGRQPWIEPHAQAGAVEKSIIKTRKTDHQELRLRYSGKCGRARATGDSPIFTRRDNGLNHVPCFVFRIIRLRILTPLPPGPHMRSERMRGGQKRPTGGIFGGMLERSDHPHFVCKPLCAIVR